MSENPIVQEQTTAPAAISAFPRNAVLSPLASSRLRAHQEEFTNGLAARVSLLFRLDFSVDLQSIETLSYKNWMQTWSKPSCLTLFKVDPLRGVSVLQMPPRLGAAIVDRLMGGPGKAADDVQEISEVERALLEQFVQIVLSEWCRRWAKFKEIKPVILGYETNGEFVQIAPDTSMLALAMEVSFGDCKEQMQIAFPYAGVEELIRQLSRTPEITAEPQAPASTPDAPKWKPCFDSVPLEVKAEWQLADLAVREIANLKVGDVLQVDARSASRKVLVRIGDEIKFHGQPGTIDDRWAIELTEAIRP